MCEYDGLSACECVAGAKLKNRYRRQSVKFHVVSCVMNFVILSPGVAATVAVAVVVVFVGCVCPMFV